MCVVSICTEYYMIKIIVGKGGLEPPPFSGLDPKSSAYANSATYPYFQLEDFMKWISILIYVFLGVTTKV